MNSIKVTFEFTTAEGAITAIARMRGLEAAPSSIVKPDPKPETAKEAAPPKSAKTEKVADTKPTAAPAAAPAAAPEKKAEPSADLYAPVGAAIAASVKTHRAELIALLTEFGAKNGKELKPEQYEAFMAKLAIVTTPADDLG
jgi:Na+-transporting methylmalonyl-CoA/oxaloacetate decarboxylase gamma subunit